VKQFGPYLPQKIFKKFLFSTRGLRDFTLLCISYIKVGLVVTVKKNNYASEKIILKKLIKVNKRL